MNTVSTDNFKPLVEMTDDELSEKMENFKSKPKLELQFCDEFLEMKPLEEGNMNEGHIERDIEHQSFPILNMDYSEFELPESINSFTNPSYDHGYKEMDVSLV